MRILATFKSFLPDISGGIATAIAAYASGLAPEFQTRVLACGMPGGRSDEIDVTGIRVRRTRTFGYVASNPISPGYFAAFREESLKSDLVALHAPFPQGDLAIQLGALRDRPLVVHWHADLVSYPAAARALAPLIRRTLARASAVIVSDASLIRIGSPIQAVASKCRVVPFGVDGALFSTLDTAEKSRIENIRAGMRPLVVACGRLVPYKGFHVLIDAARNLDADIVIIGIGPLRDSLAARVLDHGLENRIRLLGAVSDAELKLWLHAADVFVLPSVTAAETFGIVQIEAMACGTPVINTSLPTSVPLVARHECEGLTVPPGDAAALHAALRRLLHDRSLASALGEAARLRALSHYDQRSSIEAIAAIYREFILG